MITIIHDTPSIAGNYLAELRDVAVQQNKVLFRRNIQRLGVFMAHELSKHLYFEIKKIQTPLGIADCTVVNTPIVLGTILRAGLPMHQGFLDVFDDAENITEVENLTLKWNTFPVPILPVNALF
ncbi:MAG: hypothetical protein RJA90_927 [Bacteroidota bacterium]